MKAQEIDYYFTITHSIYINKTDAINIEWNIHYDYNALFKHKIINSPWTSSLDTQIYMEKTDMAYERL